MEISRNLSKQPFPTDSGKITLKNSLRDYVHLLKSPDFRLLVLKCAGSYLRVFTVLHEKKSTSGYEHDAGRKEYIWTAYMCTVFRLMINSCKIMQDSKSHVITQTTHTNLVGLFCDAG